jgi:hypothetical protein
MSTVKISKIYANHHPEPTESVLERLTDQLPDADTADRLVGRFCFVGFVVMILTLAFLS